MNDPKKSMTQTEILMEIARRYHARKLREASNPPRPKGPPKLRIVKDSD